MTTLFVVLHALTHSLAPCRDRFLEPFSSDSIWNVAIGSKAAFAPANLFSTPDLYPSSFHNDQDFIVRLLPEGNDTVEINWINQGERAADDHCALQNHLGHGFRHDENALVTRAMPSFPTIAQTRLLTHTDTI